MLPRRLLVLAVLLLLGRAATAETLMTSGMWTAFVNVINGQQVCGINTRWTGGQDLSIARWQGENQLVVQAINPGWNMSGGRIPIRMVIGSASWSASAIPLSSGSGIEFTIPLGEMQQFIRNFTGADLLILVMGGNSVRWSVNLQGSSNVVRAFSACIGQMSN